MLPKGIAKLVPKTHLMGAAVRMGPLHDSRATAPHLAVLEAAAEETRQRKLSHLSALHCTQLPLLPNTSVIPLHGLPAPPLGI